MNELQENIIVTDNDNYVRTLDKDTILYEAGWFNFKSYNWLKRTNL